MVTTNQKSIVDIHIKKKKESKFNSKVGHQITREENKRRKIFKRLTKTNIKQFLKGNKIYISIITLNVNRRNASTKRNKVAEWIQKQDLYVFYLQETHFRSRDTHRLKVRGWKKTLNKKCYKRQRRT